jgi:hypothetical protein
MLFLLKLKAKIKLDAAAGNWDLSMQQGISDF